MKLILSVILISVTWCFSILFSEIERVPVGTITSSFGDVYLKRAVQKEWIVSRVGLLLFEGDKLRTKENGKAEVLFVDGSVVYIGNDSEVEFMEQENQKEQKQSLFIFFGSMWNKVTKGSAYEVESVHALATVKGTYFNVAVEDFMEVWVKDGQVQIENQFGRIDANANTYTKASKDIAPILTPIEKEAFPDEIDVSIFYKVELAVPSVLAQNEWYVVSGQIQSNTEQASLKDLKEIQIKSKGISLSTDTKTIVDSLTLDVKEGQFECYFLSNQEKGTITVSSSDFQTLTEDLLFRAPLKQKRVRVEFMDASGQNRQLQAIFDRK